MEIGPGGNRPSGADGRFCRSLDVGQPRNRAKITIQERDSRIEVYCCLLRPLAMPAQPKTRPLGEMLQQAGLLSRAQLEVVLRDQKWQPDLRIGDILELRGWVKRDAIEFFAEQWPQLATVGRDHPIGYYFQQAGLLDSQQVDALLQEQAQAGLRIGALAVLHGWLSQETLDWFLRSLAPEESASSAFIKRRQANEGDGPSGPVFDHRISPASQARSAPQATQAQPNQPKPVAGPPAQTQAKPSLDDISWVD